MATGEPNLYDTRSAAILWDDENLYISPSGLREPFVCSSKESRSLYSENDLEVFYWWRRLLLWTWSECTNTSFTVSIFYLEGLLTKTHGLMFPELDVLKIRDNDFRRWLWSYRGLFWFGTHPRGLRWAVLDYDMPDAVKVDGKNQWLLLCW